MSTMVFFSFQENDGVCGGGSNDGDGIGMVLQRVCEHSEWILHQ